MGQFVICGFRPKPGKEADLMAVFREHAAVLGREGLITQRPFCLMKASDGCFVEVFEWKSAEAIDEAHRNPRVLELWDRFEAAAEYVAPATIAGMAGLFPGFEPIAL